MFVSVRGLNGGHCHIYMFVSVHGLWVIFIYVSVHGLNAGHCHTYMFVSVHGL